MQRQLVLLDLDRRDWQLDQRTRDLGRSGVAAARAALRRNSAAPEPARRRVRNPAA